MMEVLPTLEACRICANFYATDGSIELVHLFEPIEAIRNELEFITKELKLWNLNITCNDGLPQRICGNCFAKFCSIFAFRIECLEAQEKLLQAFVEDDCAEEIVTAQETTNGLAPLAETEVKNEKFISSDSILLGGINATQYIDGSKYEEKTDVIMELQHPNEVMELNSTLKTTTDVSLMASGQTEKETLKTKETHSNTFEEDFEDVLRSSNISKAFKDIETEAEDSDYRIEFYKNEGICELSEVSSIDDEDDSLQTDCSQNPLACQYCYSLKPIAFPSAESLSQHFFDDHDPTFPYTCPECPQKFNNSKTRLLHVKQKHLRNDHQIQRERHCQYCLKPLRGITREEHMVKCQYLGVWECDECKLQFKKVTYYTYKTHVQREHALSGQKQLKCIDCNRVFAQRTLWENHRTLHAKNTVLWCNACKEAFADTYELKKHKHKTHNGKLPVNCNYGNKAFVTHTFLNRQLQNFHPEKLNNKKNDAGDLRCTNCDTQFTSMRKLQNHQKKPFDENGRCILDVTPTQRKTRGLRSRNYNSRVFQRGIKNSQEENQSLFGIALKYSYKCEICTTMFHSSTELKQHLEATHLKLSTMLICEKCGNKFACDKDLQDHMDYHEELNEPCPETGCNFFCENLKMLNDHFFQKHSLVPCEFCEQDLPRELLMDHMTNIHNIEMTNDEPAGFVIKEAGDINFVMGPTNDDPESFVIKNTANIVGFNEASNANLNFSTNNNVGGSVTTSKTIF